MKVKLQQLQQLKRNKAKQINGSHHYWRKQRRMGAWPHLGARNACVAGSLVFSIQESTKIVREKLFWLVQISLFFCFSRCRWKAVFVKRLMFSWASHYRGLVRTQVLSLDCSGLLCQIICVPLLRRLATKCRKVEFTALSGMVWNEDPFDTRWALSFCLPLLGSPDYWHLG